MTNNFPTPPTDVQLRSVSYTMNFGAITLTPGDSLTFTGGSTNLFGAVVGLGNAGGLMFSFDTPGSFGSFDQTTIESGMMKIGMDIFQLMSDLTGQSIPSLSANFSVERTWTWVDAAGNTATYTDTMPLS